MKKIHFNIKIEAPKERVWNTLWEDNTYKKWASVFSEGSHAVTDWQEGSKVLFLSKDGDGMYSTITKKIPNKYMEFKHLGVVKNKKEEPLDDETKKWSGALENYTLKEAKGLTELTVDMDVAEDYENYFKETLPKALNKVKVIAESDGIF